MIMDYLSIWRPRGVGGRFSAGISAARVPSHTPPFGHPYREGVPDSMQSEGCADIAPC